MQHPARPRLPARGPRAALPGQVHPHEHGRARGRSHQRVCAGRPAPLLHRPQGAPPPGLPSLAHLVRTANLGRTLLLSLFSYMWWRSYWLYLAPVQAPLTAASPCSAPLLRSSTTAAPGPAGRRRAHGSAREARLAIAAHPRPPAALTSLLAAPHGSTLAQASRSCSLIVRTHQLRCRSTYSRTTRQRRRRAAGLHQQCSLQMQLHSLRASYSSPPPAVTFSARRGAGQRVCSISSCVRSQRA